MVPVMVILCVLARTIDAALRIFGGKDADPVEYIYVVRIEMKFTVNKFDVHFEAYAHVCTATVLTPIWTLSAGHCMAFTQITSIMQIQMPGTTVKYLIRYGSQSALRSRSDSFSDIIHSVMHPAFKQLNTKYGDKVSNDVGLLKTTPIILAQYGRLSAVNYPSLVGQAAAAVGYGLTRDGGKVASTLALDKGLQSLGVLIKTCEKEIARGASSPIICISRQCRDPGGALCPGDSGGPLIHHSGMVGINTMGASSDCTLQNAKLGTSSNLVGIITPISPYVEWIADQIRGNSSSVNNELSVNLELRSKSGY